MWYEVNSYLVEEISNEIKRDGLDGLAECVIHSLLIDADEEMPLEWQLETFIALLKEKATKKLGS